MRVSIVSGAKLPESLEEHVTLLQDNEARFPACIRCGHVFSSDNVHTKAGWRETQQTGFCEDCFDEVTGGDD
jgi:hypothetical protein